MKFNTPLVSDVNRNPTLEEQALARIHRLGQKKEVTTVRFYIRDSFEEASTPSCFYIRNIRCFSADIFTASYESPKVEERAYQTATFTTRQ